MWLESFANCFSMEAGRGKCETVAQTDRSESVMVVWLLRLFEWFWFFWLFWLLQWLCLNPWPRQSLQNCFEHECLTSFLRVHACLKSSSKIGRLGNRRIKSGSYLQIIEVTVTYRMSRRMYLDLTTLLLSCDYRGSDLCVRMWPTLCVCLCLFRLKRCKTSICRGVWHSLPYHTQRSCKQDLASLAHLQFHEGWLCLQTVL